jgi:sulfite dehydrogenase
MSHSDGRISRRRLVAAITAAGGLAAAGLGGCAAPAAEQDRGPSIGRVVVLGAGFGGATAARYLRLWGGNVDVTLIDRQPEFVSCPMSNLVLGGWRDMAGITQSQEGLRAVGVKLVRGEVQGIDVNARRLRLAGGVDIPYDRLIVSPGVDFITGEIGGLDQALASGAVLHAWKAGPQTLALRRQLEDMPDGGVFAITIPKAPYRCPPGPYERACLVASYLKQAKPRSKVLVLDANPEIQSKKALFERAFAEHYAGLVEYRPNADLKEVSGRLAKFDFEDVRADVLNVVPPQRAADVVRAAGLANVNARWIGVNWLTLESTAAPGVHALGDAVLAAAAMPKSAHMANQHAKLAAAAVFQLLKGEAVNPAPVLMNTCYSFVTPGDAIHVASVHRYDAADKTFKTVPGAGGVSATASALEGRYALSWAENIWRDTLG